MYEKPLKRNKLHVIINQFDKPVPNNNFTSTIQKTVSSEFHMKRLNYTLIISFHLKTITSHTGIKMNFPLISNYLSIDIYV